MSILQGALAAYAALAVAEWLWFGYIFYVSERKPATIRAHRRGRS